MDQENGWAMTGAEAVTKRLLSADSQTKAAATGAGAPMPSGTSREPGEACSLRPPRARRASHRAGDTGFGGVALTSPADVLNDPTRRGGVALWSQTLRSDLKLRAFGPGCQGPGRVSL